LFVDIADRRGWLSGSAGSQFTVSWTARSVLAHRCAVEDYRLRILTLLRLDNRDLAERGGANRCPVCVDCLLVAMRMNWRATSGQFEREFGAGAADSRSLPCSGR